MCTPAGGPYPGVRRRVYDRGIDQKPRTPIAPVPAAERGAVGASATPPGDHEAVYTADDSVSLDEADYTATVAALRSAGCVFAEDEARILLDTAASPAQLGEMLERRVSGIPLEHVVGWVEFCGLRVSVDTNVFVPRQRSRLVVAEATRVVSPGAVVLDLCCGCGALGLALAAEVSVELHAADVSDAAVACARRNLAPVHGRVYQGDLFAAVPAALRGRLDLILCNAPYVPTDMIGTMPPEARLHEPLVTLDGGWDGLEVVRRVADEAPRWLRAGGHLIVESSEEQAPEMTVAFGRAGLTAHIEHDDELGATVVIGTLVVGPAEGRGAGGGALSSRS